MISEMLVIDPWQARALRGRKPHITRINGYWFCGPRRGNVGRTASGSTPRDAFMRWWANR